MSSRALRRLQKEQLALAEHQSSDEESDDYEPPSKAKNLFDLLNEGDEAEQQEEEEEEEEASLNIQSQSSPNKTNINNKSKKNKKKKKQNKTNKKQDVSEMSLEELNDMLDTLKTTDSQATEATNEETELQHQDPEASLTPTTRQLISVHYRYLDPDAEMKRMFGSRVVNRETRLSGRLLKKTKLVTAKIDWPIYKKYGMTMETLGVAKHGTTSFAFQHQEIYQDLQLDYLNAIAQHEPEGLFRLLSQYHYHVDSMIQISDIAKQHGDWAAAGDCIDRALYACERAFHPLFTFGSGTVRLPYQRSENRSFFIAVVRHIEFLTRRGCWRTAFEFNKLLFSLSPFEDPTGALLTMDYYALSAREYQYVLDFGKHWKSDGQNYPKDVSFLPNFAFSMAYAKFKLHQQNNKDENNDQVDKDDDLDGSKLLRIAISRFPGFVLRLMEETGISDPIVDQQLSFFTQTTTDDYLTLLLTMYVDRIKDLWKEPEVLNWLQVNISHVLKDNSYHNGALTSIPRENSSNEDALPMNVCRHVLLQDRREWLSLLPRSVTDETYYASDPLPPPDSVTGYDLDERMRVRRNNPRDTSQGGLLAMLQALVAGGQLAPGNQQRIREVMNQIRGRSGRDQIPGAFPGQDEQEASPAVMVEDPMDGSTAPPPSHEDTEYTEEEWHQIQDVIERHEERSVDNEDIDDLVDEEDVELQQALAMSTQQLQEDMERRSQHQE
ncbi:transcriptional repressor TCF25-domain-containing protein [Halteromyces radiatus]|uniref:transcriptional repressor TCF25-domain-containing protein n=1 Tax=Halteromyces radiatus TaxID=101107 RepID=UPI0022202C8B|nr:transcriptional repressor TCF25-domain-containing protein [Halteromyces radiatus]KAI8089506.1 transcriptional repressor TCF25-domain-containing protein [Halteromyces radiatus]